jgi:hypothetical protein
MTDDKDPPDQPIDLNAEREKRKREKEARAAERERKAQEKEARRARVNPAGGAAALNELNADYAVVKVGGRTRVLSYELSLHEANGERYEHHVPTYMKFEDFRNFYLNRLTLGADGTPFALNSRDQPYSIGEWWLKQTARRTYRGVVFAPNGEREINGCINLWQGFSVEPKKGSWSRMKDHVFEVLSAGDDAFFAYCMKWLAFLLQRPSAQAEVVLGFKGGFGTGKGLLGRAMCLIFGPHARHVSSPDHLTGKFNAYQQYCCFLFADEAIAPQDKRAEGVMKRLITEPTLMCEPKGIDPFQADNHISILQASNHDWSFLAGEHERRIVMQKVAETHRQEKRWFDPLNAELFEQGGLAALMFDLLDMNLGDWHPRQIVRTKALAGQQMESLNPLDAWLLELLTAGVLPGALDKDPSVARSNEWEEEVALKGGSFQPVGGPPTRWQRVKRMGLYDHARKSSPRLRQATDTALGRYLREQVKCLNWHATKERGWRFPPLPELRDAWVQRYPDTVWPEGDCVNWGDHDGLEN